MRITQLAFYGKVFGGSTGGSGGVEDDNYEWTEYYVGGNELQIWNPYGIEGGTYELKAKGYDGGVWKGVDTWAYDPSMPSSSYVNFSNSNIDSVNISREERYEEDHNGDLQLIEYLYFWFSSPVEFLYLAKID